MYYMYRNMCNTGVYPVLFADKIKGLEKFSEELSHITNYLHFVLSALCCDFCCKKYMPFVYYFWELELMMENDGK